jgi:hypothetical protein
LQAIKVSIQDKHLRTPLWLACAGTMTEAADLEPCFVAVYHMLLRHPLQDVNLCDQDGRSPLWLMSDFNHLTSVNALLEHPQVHQIKCPALPRIFVPGEVHNSKANHSPPFD